MAEKQRTSAVQLPLEIQLLLILAKAFYILRHCLVFGCPKSSSLFCVLCVISLIESSASPHGDASGQYLRDGQLRVCTTGCKSICTNTDRHVLRRTLEMHGWSIIFFWRIIFWKSLGTLECWMWSCHQDVSHLSGPRDPMLSSTCQAVLRYWSSSSFFPSIEIDEQSTWRWSCLRIFEICISCNFCKLVFCRDSGVKKSARMTQEVSHRRQTTRPDVDEEPFMSSWAWWQASRIRSRVHRPLEWARNGAGSTAQDGTRKCPRGLPDWPSRDQRDHVLEFSSNTSPQSLKTRCPILCRHSNSSTSCRNWNCENPTAPLVKS